MRIENKHQQLMDEAYDKWQAGLYTSYDHMVESVSDLHKMAIVLGNLNCQVENGGFYQWVDNGYGQMAHEAVEYLNKIGTENAKKVAKWIEDLIPHIDFDQEGLGCFTQHWVIETETYCETVQGDWNEEEEEYEEYEEEYEEEYCGGWSIAKGLDSQYYELNKELMKEILNYLQTA
jgi:hypothetical protein